MRDLQEVVLPPSSRLAGLTILGSPEHETTAAALIALTPINAKAIPARRVSTAGAAHIQEHGFKVWRHHSLGAPVAFSAFYITALLLSLISS